METAQHRDRLAKNQPAEIAMFQISEVQESPAFNGRRSFLTLRCCFDYESDAVGIPRVVAVGNESGRHARVEQSQRQRPNDCVAVSRDDYCRN